MDYDDYESEDSVYELDDLPLVIFMGRKRSGKSSIIKTVFDKMSPEHSMYLESTTTATVTRIKTLFDFNIVELPGQIDYFSVLGDASLFTKANTIVYVIDTSDEFHVAVRDLSQIAYKMSEINPSARIEVFLHKIDTIEEDYRAELSANISSINMDYLFEGGKEDSLNINYYNTSIFDQSIYDSLSKILSEFVPGYSDIERLITSFVEHSSIEKAFLCDLRTKLYFATDSSAFDFKVYEVCADFIDLSVDLYSLVCDDEAIANDEVNDEVVASDHESAERDLHAPLIESFKKQKCIATLHEGSKLYLSVIMNDLCLVTWVKGGAASDAAAVIPVLDYNATILKEGIEQIFVNTNSSSSAGRFRQTVL